ncbi:MAG: hypothetical protein R3E34_08795 [Rhodocyclaceae bacterium]
MQQAGRHIPLVAIIGHDADRFLVQAQDELSSSLTIRRLKPYAVPHRKAAHQHRAFRLRNELQAPDDQAVEEQQIVLIEPFDRLMADTRSTIFTLPGFMAESMPSSV